MVWYVVSCLIFFEIVEVQQLKAKYVRYGLECFPSARVTSFVSVVKDQRVSELTSASSMDLYRSNRSVT